VKRSLTNISIILNILLDNNYRINLKPRFISKFSHLEDELQTAICLSIGNDNLNRLVLMPFDARKVQKRCDMHAYFIEKQMK